MVEIGFDMVLLDLQPHHGQESYRFMFDASLQNLLIIWLFLIDVNML